MKIVIYWGFIAWGGWGRVYLFIYMRSVNFEFRILLIMELTKKENIIISIILFKKPKKFKYFLYYYQNIRKTINMKLSLRTLKG